jgi:hypothetical protein
MVHRSFRPFSAPSPDITFQAIYCMLYIVCVWILLRRRANGFMWQLTSSTLLFFLETVNLALEGAYVLYSYFISVSVAENWPDSPHQGFQPDRIVPIIIAAMEVASLLCLCVQSATSNVTFLTVAGLAGWLISYWQVAINVRCMQIHRSFRSTVVI